MCFSDLTNQIDRLSREVELAQLKEGERVRSLTQEQKKLLGLQEHVHWLRYRYIHACVIVHDKLT